MKRLIYDRVTAQLEVYGRANFERLLEVAMEAFEERAVLTPLPTDTHDDFEEYRKVNERLSSKGQAIAARHDFFEIMILVRKVPATLCELLLSKFRRSGKYVPPLSVVHTNSALIATNWILKNSRGSRVTRFSYERNHLTPGQETMDDAILIFWNSFLFSINTYYLNTIARRLITPSISLDFLVNSYNQRIFDNRPSIAISEENPIVMLSSVSDLDDKNRFLSVRDKKGSYTLRLINYYPLPASADEMIDQYIFLDTEDFNNSRSLDFDKFCSAWRYLNRLLLSSFPETLGFEEIMVNDRITSMRVERFFDCCETGLGGGDYQDLSEKCFPDFINGFTHEDWRIFLDSLYYSPNLIDDVNFVEQPFVFYQVGEGTFLWDNLRHGGYFKAIARRLVQLSGETGKKKGDVFERRVLSIVSQIPGARITNSLKIRVGGNVVLEIDIVVEIQDIAFLIEAKSYLKAVKYHLPDPGAVSARTEKMEGILRDRDAKLNAYWPQIRSKLPGVNGAISICCSDEVGYVASMDQLYWLSKSTPRILTPIELERFLRSQEASDLSSHPSYVGDPGVNQS